MRGWHYQTIGESVKDPHSKSTPYPQSPRPRPKPKPGREA